MNEDPLISESKIGVDLLAQSQQKASLEMAKSRQAELESRKVSAQLLLKCLSKKL